MVNTRNGSPTPHADPMLAEHLDRVVSQDLDAQLRNFHQTDQFFQSDGKTVERVFIVVWRKSLTEWGTHRVCIADGWPARLSMCVWGHYHRGPKAMVEAYKDYNKRIASGI